MALSDVTLLVAALSLTLHWLCNFFFFLFTNDAGPRESTYLVNLVMESLFLLKHFSFPDTAALFFDVFHAIKSKICKSLEVEALHTEREAASVTQENELWISE